jgi:hypothetical protein
MSLRPHLRDILAFARNLGIIDARIEQGGKHPHLVGTTAGGRALRYVLPGSPSDGKRGRLNLEAGLRRACRPAVALDEAPERQARKRRRQRRGGQRAPGKAAPGPNTLGVCHRGGARPATPSSPFNTQAMHALKQRLLLAAGAQANVPPPGPA